MVRNRSTVKAEPLLPQGQLAPGLFLEVYVLAQLVGRLVGDGVAPTGLSATEHAVHSAIAVLGSVTPTELARRLGLPATTLSAIIAQLAERGEVRRARNPADGRSYVLELSARGRRTHDQASRAVQERRQRVADRLAEAEEAVLQSLLQLEAALRAELTDPQAT